MAAKFMQLVLTPAVQTAQERYFGKHQVGVPIVFFIQADLLLEILDETPNRIQRITYFVRYSG